MFYAINKTTVFCFYEKAIRDKFVSENNSTTIKAVDAKKELTSDWSSPQVHQFTDGSDCVYFAAQRLYSGVYTS